MENVLELENVGKKYATFELKNVSFSLEKGSIMGFIGRNGSGKSTTLKAIMNLIPFTGSVKMNGEEFAKNEEENKQNIAFILGGVNVYQFVSVKSLAKVTSKFYKHWEQDTFNKYISLFNIDVNKKIKELSQGMKVKLNLALALSHQAKVLLLDEPTSGLDPVSRDEILQIFLDLVHDEEISILFSTQIVSDLERCADYITYIRNGQIMDSALIKDFVSKYLLVKGDAKKLSTINEGKIIGKRIVRDSFEGLIRIGDAGEFKDFDCKNPDIEDVMIFNEREAL
ncbi:MAG: ABC transporter ATP-binding protein [Bacilli bacterium]